MKILTVIAVVGCCITWPILLPLHVHGGGTSTQLDCLTFGNVTDSNYYYIHAFVGWVYFGTDNADNPTLHVADYE